VRGEYHRHRRAARHRRRAVESTFADRQQEVEETIAVERDERLGFGIAESRVVLKDLGAVRGQHDPGVEDPR